MKSTIRTKILFTCLTSWLLLCAEAVVAQSSPPQVDKASAAKKAQQKVNGQVLKVDKRKNNYRVKILQKSGRVVSVDVNKKSGQVSQKKDKK